MPNVFFYIVVCAIVNNVM